MSPSVRHRSRPCRAQGLAWLVSAAVHGMILGALVTRRPPDMPASLGQRVGALTVRFENQPRLTAQTTTAQTSQPKAAVTTKRTAHAAPVAQAAPPTTPPLMAAISPPPAPVPAPTPGATFANLFAPIISRPMGRGRWGAAPPPAMPPPDPSIQREQATAARRAQLMQSVERLRALMTQTPLRDACDVRVSLSQSLGSISCSDEEDLSLMRTSLNDFLTQQAQGQELAEACLHLHARDITWVPCQVSETAQPAGPQP